MIHPIELKQMVNAHDRLDECLRRVCGFGLVHVYEIASQDALMQIASAANKSIRRTKTPDGTVAMVVEYNGLRFVHRISSSDNPAA